MLALEKERVFYYFEKISSIPRESGKEMAVSNWIFNWTKELGLEAAQDAAFNLVIRKKASPGYEASQPLILQAHLDMVCEKTPESSHDFTKDPIKLKVEEDWLVSACQTTLGADNGIGIAYAMAILEDKSLRHPPLEVIFTVEEETTFKGANFLSTDLYKGRRMINLDHANDQELIAGSCGGTGMYFTLPLLWEKQRPTGYRGYRVRLKGLLGGHSGEDIHLGRANAICLMMRFLEDVCKGGVKVAAIEGGTNRLAIPREAQALLLSEERCVLEKKAAKWTEIFRQEYGVNAAQLVILVEEIREGQGKELLDIQADEIKPLKDGEFEKAATIVRLFPDGITAMSGDFLGLVNSSNNLGILKVSEIEGELSIVTEIRGQCQSMTEQIGARIETLAEVFNARTGYFAGYVSWDYSKDSALRKTALDVYEEMFGEKMRVSTVHAGLEGGIFAKKVQGMDIISIGPDCQYFHSPMERVSISSVRKMYRYLIRLLEAAV